MKRFIGIYLLLSVCLLTGIFLAFGKNVFPKPETADLIKINRIADFAARNWEHPENLREESFPYDFIILSREGQLWFQSRGDLPVTRTEAAQAGMITWEISKNDTYLGDILVEIQPEEVWDQLQKEYQRKVLLLFAAVLFFLAGAFLYIYKRILSPFIRLEKFAMCISDGQLNHPLPMDRHNLFGAFTESFDVMRTSLLEARQAAIAADKSKKELIASLSHDIKTPVTSVQLILELLQVKYPGDPYLQQKLSAILDKTGQIEQLTGNLLHSTLEELEELTVQSVSEPSHTLAELLEKADTEGVLADHTVPSCLVEMDISRTRQVLENIISNSRKYAGTPISVFSSIEGNFLHLKLEDSGPGVQPEEIELVYDKYFRGAQAAASGKEGEGMGLYLARNMMRKMGGDMEVYNCRPGFGVHLLFALSNT